MLFVCLHKYQVNISKHSEKKWWQLLFRNYDMGNTICPGHLPQTCHFPFSTKIQFTLILLLSLILIMIFIKIRHLTRTNFLFFIYMPAVCKINLEDITSESSIICVTENHLDGKILDNYIIIDGFQRSSWSWSSVSFINTYAISAYHH